LPHDAAALHVTGAARYIDDIPVPAGCLHLAFGLSEIAHGEITDMDLTAVRAAPGVVAVIAPGDLAEMPDCSPSIGDEPLLSTGEVCYLGQPLFIVVAESHLAARRAARLGKIGYAEREAILTVEQALAAGSYFEGGPVTWARGDAEAAMAGAAHVIEGRLEIGGQEHFYLEGQAALALPQEGGDMHIHSSTQHPSEIQHKVAHALHLPMSAVRVEVRRMGGGFGGKESQGNALAVASALAARATGRPCKMRYDRDDDMMITGKRHDFIIDYRLGADSNGRIRGISFRHFARCGWAQDLSLAVCDRSMLHADNAYHLPDIRIESHRLKTHMQSATAFRGFGGPQGMLGIERAMDHLAHHLGRDPLEIRRINFYAEAGGKLAAPQRTPYGQEVEDFILHGMIARLEESAAYQARRQAVAAWNAAHDLLKRGLALTPVKFGISFTLSHLNQAGALVHLYQDGSIHMNHGGTEMGQGLFQKVAQVAAASFGVDPGRVKITATDTAKVPNTSATAASSGSDLNGMAVKAACDEIRGRLAAFLAGQHQCAPEQVFFENGRVFVGTEEYGFDEVAALAYRNRISLSATGYYKTPKITWDRIRGEGRPFFYFAYGAALTEVVIDRLTGENRILRTDILHDAGTSLNPALDIGQIEGGYVQGAGWRTTEELVWD
ncbi:xanthine dehydrogenase molybdopterin binding subunit, partial [Thioclava sp. BHET1]